MCFHRGREASSKHVWLVDVAMNLPMRGTSHVHRSARHVERWQETRCWVLYDAAGADSDTHVRRNTHTPVQDTRHAVLYACKSTQSLTSTTRQAKLQSHVQQQQKTAEALELKAILLGSSFFMTHAAHEVPRHEYDDHPTRNDPLT